MNLETQNTNFWWCCFPSVTNLVLFEWVCLHIFANNGRVQFKNYLLMTGSLYHCTYCLCLNWIFIETFVCITHILVYNRRGLFMQICYLWLHLFHSAKRGHGLWANQLLLNCMNHYCPAPFSRQLNAWLRACALCLKQAPFSFMLLGNLRDHLMLMLSSPFFLHP